MLGAPQRGFDGPEGAGRAFAAGFMGVLIGSVSLLWPVAPAIGTTLFIVGLAVFFVLLLIAGNRKYSNSKHLKKKR